MAHWHIVGVGAIGCLWVQRLIDHGQTVTLILHSDEAIAKYESNHGIHITDLQGAPHQYQPEAIIASSLKLPIQNVLITTKSWQCADALASIQTYLDKASKVVLLQNGYGQLIDAKKHLTEQQYYVASTTDGAYLERPFHLKIAGLGATHIGVFNDKARAACALPTAEFEPNINLILWKKLCINAIINPLTALYDIDNGAVLTHDKSRVRLKALCAELQDLITALSLEFEVEAQVRQVAQQTAPNSSSMRQDVRLHRQTEIEEITGYLMSVAYDLGLPCPENRLIYEQIKQQSL